MNGPTELFDFPDLPDEAVVAIDTFLEDFYTRFQNHYFAQMHRCTANTTIVPTRTSIRSRYRCPIRRSDPFSRKAAQPDLPAPLAPRRAAWPWHGRGRASPSVRRSIINRENKSIKEGDRSHRSILHAHRALQRFNGRFRDECLNEHWFVTMDARRVIEGWRIEYNTERPHDHTAHWPR